MIVLEINTIVVYLACIIFLFLIGRFFILPLKTIAKLLGNSILGAILIFLINLVGGLFEFHIGLNIGTAIVTGILGLPRSSFVDYFKIVVRVSDFLGIYKLPLPCSNVFIFYFHVATPLRACNLRNRL